ncbi:MAG TPA: serine/threonine-protein kinase [Kofleriaceae bacterium]|nr:serine/threonine-protein kinase [Kofleriaceae bacterium]
MELLAGETVVDDVHRVETLLLDARAVPASDSDYQVTPDARIRPRHAASIEGRLPPSPPRAEDDAGTKTNKVPRELVVGAQRPSGFSSEPPTRHVDGVDDHIELPGGSVIDDYEIETKIGEGAMGVVYRARHLRLGRSVALKVIAPQMGADPQAIARFEREARALASIHHPNIVDVHAFGALPDGRSYFAMEALSGEPLDDRIARGRVGLGEALDVLDQVARALEAAHAQGVVHRDLKPSNIFLVRIPREQRWVVKLLDFGLVKTATPDEAERTASGAVIGTALYISPEQARGPDVDGRTDVYALGCIAYELVLGRHPFPTARTPTSAIAAHLVEPPPQPRLIWPGIPAALDLLLHAMIAKDPSYRPSLAQVRSVLASVQSPTTTAGRAARAATMPVARGSSRVWIWIALLVVLALVVGIAIGVGIGGKSSDPAPASAPPPQTGVTPPGDRQSAHRAVVTPIDDAGAPPVPKPVDADVGDRTCRDSPGYLQVFSVPSGRVLVDGSDTGRETPVSKPALRLAPGRHKVTLVIGDDRFSYPVVIKAGATSAINKEPY